MPFHHHVPKLIDVRLMLATRHPGFLQLHDFFHQALQEAAQAGQRNPKADPEFDLLLTLPLSNPPTPAMLGYVREYLEGEPFAHLQAQARAYNLALSAPELTSFRAGAAAGPGRAAFAVGWVIFISIEATCLRRIAA